MKNKIKLMRKRGLCQFLVKYEDEKEANISTRTSARSSSELNYVKDVLFCNGYPIKLIENITDRQLKKVIQEKRELVPLDSVILVIENKTFTTLPYILKFSDKLGKKNKKNIISAFFKIKQKLNIFSTRERIKLNLNWVVVSTESSVHVGSFPLVGPINN